MRTLDHTIAVAECLSRRKCELLLHLASDDLAIRYRTALPTLKEQLRRKPGARLLPTSKPEKLTVE